jgi:4-amino-4-deoxy-L-arabinose transferase-like glycosyltransferase
MIVVYLGYLIASRIRSEWTGLVAAAFIAFEPLQFWATGQFQTEATSAFLLMIFCCLGFSITEARRRSWTGIAMLLGLTLAAASFVRPATYYLPLFVIPLLVLAARGRAKPMRVAAIVAAFVVPYTLLVGSWQVRNHAEAGSWRFSGVEAYNMLAYRGAGTEAQVRGIGVNLAKEQVLDEFGSRRRGESEGQYLDRMYRAGIEIVLDHPGATARATATSVAGTALGVRHTILPHLRIAESSSTIRLAQSLLIATWGLAIVGVLLSVRNDRVHRTGHAIAVTTISYVILVSALAGGDYSRFRAPVMPIVCVYAACGAAALISALTRRAVAARTPQVDAAV